MLPADHRMRRRADFTAAVRTGRRASSPSLVLHLVRRPGVDDPAKVGLIVSKSVGGSVVRHRVARRIRAACLSLLSDVEPGDLVVVRALPGASHATTAQLGADLDLALARLLRRPSAALGAAS